MTPLSSIAGCPPVGVANYISAPTIMRSPATATIGPRLITMPDATNGPVTLRVPSGYQSGVILESDGHGPFSCRARVCSEGRKNWDEDRKSVEFGSGPTVVRVSTVNGPVSVI